MKTRLNWRFIALLLVSCHASAGVVIGGTRFIFAQDEKALVVSLRNTDKKPFLVQSKVVNDNGSSTSGLLNPAHEPQKPPFIVNPPMVVINGGEELQVKVLYTGEALPADRESQFWLSVAAIPSTSSVPASQVKIAVSQQVKMFWRPSSLLETNANEGAPLIWQRQGKQLTVRNDSPWYATLSSLKVNGKNVKAGMVPPFNQRTNEWCPAQGECDISWQKLGDRGEMLKRVTVRR